MDGINKIILSLNEGSLQVAKPDWLKIRPPTEQFHEVKSILKKHGLVTVCQEAHCPNMAECWSCGTATFMVMGDTCTRGCRFCNVKTARFGKALDPEEPQKIVRALREMNILDYIVLTSVDRDDLPDQGASHFAACIRALKDAMPNLLVEVLIPDFQGNTELVNLIIASKPDVIAHNLETVKRLQKTVRDPRAGYEQSLSILDHIKKTAPHIVTKSALMVGLGETKEEIIEAMKDLRNINVQVLTIGQYLRPKSHHLPVQEYVHPKVFQEYESQGLHLGFSYVASGPLVRSSYKAGEYYIKNIVDQNIREETLHAEKNHSQV